MYYVVEITKRRGNVKVVNDVQWHPQDSLLLTFPLYSHLAQLKVSIHLSSPRSHTQTFSMSRGNKEEDSCLIFLIKSEKIFPRSLSYPTSPLALMINWPELGHRVHAEPLTVDITAY